ncbi:MAG: ribonuclease D [Caulobacterales bacterium]|uniref:ribonuclease D n=1 Tax=Glycocaulis sp. TaxID=1969725 RepID=UPI003FA0388C
MELIQTTDALANACEALGKDPYIAVDTEFMRESTFWPQLCLIQAAGSKLELLIDPLADGIDLAPFLALLKRTDTVKVFHACRQDLEIFFHKGGELIPEPLFDSQIAASAVGLGDSISYDNLVRELLGKEIDKGSRFTDWSRRPLSDRQAEYALADVTHLHKLYPILKDRLEKSGREEWVKEEMRLLTNPETYRMDPENAWKRLKPRKTTAKWLAAMKAAARWREIEAQTRDVPRSRIMKDDGIYELAQSAPVSQDQLAALRAVPKGFERSKPAERLMEMMREAMEAPEKHAPKLARQNHLPANIGPVVELLKVFLRVVAEDEGVAPRLIATVPDLEQIAANDKADVPALSGWRYKVFGEAALKLKRGELALVLENGKVITVELED